MVRFSCFSTSLHSHKSKKIIQQAGGTMQLNCLVDSEDQQIKLPVVSTSSNLKADENNSLESQLEQITGQSLQEGCWKPDACSEDSQDFLLKAKVRRSKSLGNILDKIRGSSCANMVQEDEVDKGFSLDNIHQLAMNKLDKTDGINLNEDRTDSGSKLQNQMHESNKFEFHNISLVEPVRKESIFSIGVVEQSDIKDHGYGHHDSADEQSADHDYSGHISSDIRPIRAKSCSPPSLRLQNGSVKLEFMGSHSRSFGNLSFINDERIRFLDGDEASYSRLTMNRGKAPLDAHYISHELDLDELVSNCHSELREGHLSNNSSGCNDLSDPERDGKYFIQKCNDLSDPERDGTHFIQKCKSDNQLVDIKVSPCDADSGERCSHPSYDVGYYDRDEQERNDEYWYENDKHDSQLADGNDHSSNAGHAIEVVEPGTEGAATWRLKESSAQNFNESTIPVEPNTSRIAAWISQLDVQNFNIVEEPGESSNSISDKEAPKRAGMIDSKKLDTKSSLGMVVAYNYISTLNPTSSTAQMANLGLVAIPVLTSFVGLRMLNLSGNGIVRITAGALPKGLHMLNLSKNNISVIEGLRELTRLRVLDLSYNKISRIGHGLASCSTLKELYLAGNKISEIEGLHRLLKLSILDLRCNRISTSKGLGQLAANYASLQAIHLEGNPAQKNVGDEQLKKYLLSLLPHLAYYNRQVVRANGSKEVLDRPRRSFSSHQSDRSFRSERKESLRGSRKSSYSHIKSSNAPTSSIKSSKSRHRPLTPMTPKPTNYLLNASKNLLGLQPGNSLRRIQSEGTL